MIEQDNSEINLRMLVTLDRITFQEYLFRQGAQAMNIKTYQYDSSKTR
tara:strand:+ start:1428 stop:1571 length:144 start_codon:yes stop_codon:yes gene_type:complete